MQTLRAVVGIAWAVFWIGWLLAAFGAKQSLGRGWGRLGPRGIAAIAVLIVIRADHAAGLEVRSPVVGAVGTVLFAAGIAVAVWARVILGRNWGMPTSQRLEPELITSGPYALVRHPIYTGILLAVVGTGLVINFISLAVAVIIGAYFLWAARVEERNMTATFPQAYPAYRAHTKMLIPFLL